MYPTQSNQNTYPVMPDGGGGGKSFMKIVLVFVILVLITGGVTLFFIKKNGLDIMPSSNNQTVNETANLPASEVDIAQPTPNQNAIPPQAEFTKCSSLDCLKNIIRNCDKGDFTYSSEVPFIFEPLISYSSKAKYEVKGKNASGLCELTQQLISASVSATEANKSKLLARGMTAEELNQQLSKINQSFEQPGAKTASTCTGSGVNLVTYLDNNLNPRGEVEVNCKMGLGQDSVCTYNPGVTCVTPN